MARTKGARDAKPRRKPDPRNAQKTRQLPGTHLGQTTPPAPAGPGPAVKQAPVPERPAIPTDEFKRAIAAELHKEAQAPPGQDSAGQPAGSPPAPAADFDPAALTIEGLANAWRLPFYALARLLAWLRVAPDPDPIEAVGRRHARTMAKASWPIWDHYARQYVDVHPDQAVNAAIGVTVLDGIGIVPDLIDAIGESRRRAARMVSPPVGPPASPPSASQPPGTAG